MEALLTEIEDVCRQIVEDTEHLLSWEWDQSLDVALAVVRTDQAKEALDVLDACFPSCWDYESIIQAPAAVRAISRTLDGVRKTQMLFVTRPDDPVMAYAAWWPWGDGQRISIRIGLVLDRVDDLAARRITEEFIEWFTGIEAV